MTTMYRPTLKDITVSRPSGSYLIDCDGSCDNPRLDHMFMGYTKKEALQVWRLQHPRKAV
jgi:hypothetical protein